MTTTNHERTELSILRQKRTTKETRIAKLTGFIQEAQAEIEELTAKIVLLEQKESSK